MNDSLKLTLPKVERLNSRILIERLFTGGSKSLPAFPLRIVYMPVEGENLPAATILISVPKKRFKRAVKRNRVKRQVREAYRKNKHILLDALKDSGRKIAIAFIWLDNELHESADVEAKVVKLPICHRSDTKARTFQRALLSHTTHSSLPPLGRFGI